MADEYARRGARLALAARREDQLRLVADKARELGSPDVWVIRADAAKVDDCEQVVHDATKHFGQCKYAN